MDGVTLHRLGKRITELSADVVRTSRPDDYTPAEKAVLSVLLHRAHGTVTELVRETGFTQSHVSATVARLRAKELVTSAADPSDSRRQLLALTARARRGVRRRLERPADDALERALGVERGRRAETLLAELAELVLGDDRPGERPPREHPTGERSPSERSTSERPTGEHPPARRTDET